MKTGVGDNANTSVLCGISMWAHLHASKSLEGLTLHCPGLDKLFPFRPSHLSFFSVKTMVVWDYSIPQEIDTSPGHASRVSKAFPDPAAASRCLSSHHFDGDVAPPA